MKFTGRPRTPTLSWQVCEDEQAWQVIQTQRSASATGASHMPPPRRPWWHPLWHTWGLPGILIISLLVAVTAWWSWQRAQLGLAEIGTELEAKVIAELWRDTKAKTTSGVIDVKTVKNLELPSDPSEIVTQVEIRDLGRDRAVVEVMLQPTQDGPSYRQTRLYRQRERGWLRASPSAARWGDARSLQSQYFVFHYQALDEAAVVQAAPRLDELAPMISRLFNEKLGADHKVAFVVDPEHVPRIILLESEPQSSLTVASPTAALVPSDMAASDVLLQALVIALFNRFTRAEIVTDNPPSSWFRLHEGLRLWFFWDQQLSLAIWHEPLVQWVLEGSSEADVRRAHGVPDFARDLCAHHSIWMPSPLEVDVPILCWQRSDGEPQLATWPYYDTIASLSLDSLLYSEIGSQDDTPLSGNVRLREPGPFAIVMATVFEYVAATYGRGMIFPFLAAIPKHEQAETLIPAVFGVPLASFTAGWHEFLNERYGLESFSLSASQAGAQCNLFRQ